MKDRFFEVPINTWYRHSTGRFESDLSVPFARTPN
jgi:hypothetical protein